jgi:hypothetical protein
MDDKARDALFSLGVLPANAVKQMERWKTVPEGSHKKLGGDTSVLGDLNVHEIPDFKECNPDIKRIMKNLVTIGLVTDELDLVKFSAGVDCLGRYFIALQSDFFVRRYVNYMRENTILLTNNNDFKLVKDVGMNWITNDDKTKSPTHWILEVRGREDGE